MSYSSFMELKKNELLDVLKDVDSSKDILGQEVIKYLADAKWREISLAMKLWTFLYWALLVLVVEGYTATARSKACKSAYWSLIRF